MNYIEIADRHWRIVSFNGKILCHSEQYASKSNTIRAAKRFSESTGFPVRQATSTEEK